VMLLLCKLARVWVRGFALAVLCRLRVCVLGRGVALQSIWQAGAAAA
jgi:hypothetical protein